MILILDGKKLERVRGKDEKEYWDKLMEGEGVEVAVAGWWQDFLFPLLFSFFTP